MATGKFKTVSGYLRSADEQMLCKIPWDASDEARVAATKVGQRGIINNLLPQLGMPRLDANETPLDGIERLLANGGTTQQVKALKDCQRWLKSHLVALNSRMQVTVQSGAA